MNASDVMTVRVITIEPEATVQAAAKLMLERGISALPVVNKAGALVGIISEGDLVRRVAEHRDSAVPGFTVKYGVTRLVWFETHDAIEAAIRREKRLKRWRRAWKVVLIQSANPEWRDLWAELTGSPGQAGR